jgi:hypothetical protein
MMAGANGACFTIRLPASVIPATRVPATHSAVAA